jgi:tetratricopeptide (TPR) repeat protein
LRRQLLTRTARNAAGIRARAQSGLALVLEEEGRADQARTLLADAVRRLEVVDPSWTPDDEDDGIPRLLAMARELKALPEAELAARQTGAERQRRTPYARQLMQLELARTAEEAARVTRLRWNPQPQLAGGYVVYRRAAVALLAGDKDQAITLLRDALSRCDRLMWPIEAQRARLLLGQLLEEAGQTEGQDGARAQYQAILAAWGSATPGSVTADEARRRLKALDDAIARPWRVPVRATRPPGPPPARPGRPGGIEMRRIKEELAPSNLRRVLPRIFEKKDPKKDPR